MTSSCIPDSADEPSPDGVQAPTVYADCDSMRQLQQDRAEVCVRVTSPQESRDIERDCGATFIYIDEEPPDPESQSYPAYVCGGYLRNTTVGPAVFVNREQSERFTDATTR